MGVLEKKKEIQPMPTFTKKKKIDKLWVYAKNELGLPSRKSE